MEQYAVIKTGGKQYLVTPGKTLKVEKLATPEGETVVFDKILLAGEGEDLKIGAPVVEGARVSAKVLKHGKGKKIVVLKYKAKKRETTKKGHRQQYTEVQITEMKA